ncbi:Leucine-rich_repeat domain superfamily [Hexamita inflata]|uniref:Leucine-rich repeat domain superfamily n=1 Tax=Hexamita inflata TaxID=28002 RepID=A0AA86UFR7_9EUKA|nr:Leucine-rich repeat domain superfamily [Hexamita inflata]
MLDLSDKRLLRADISNYTIAPQLDISRNYITDFDFLARFKQVNYLIAREVNLQSIEQLPQISYSNLQKLDISSNHIHDLYGFGPSKLQYMVVNNNPLLSVDFKNLTELKHVHFKNTPLNPITVYLQIHSPFKQENQFAFAQIKIKTNLKPVENSSTQWELDLRAQSRTATKPKNTNVEIRAHSVNYKSVTEIQLLQVELKQLAEQQEFVIKSKSAQQTELLAITITIDGQSQYQIYNAETGQALSTEECTRRYSQTNFSNQSLVSVLDNSVTTPNENARFKISTTELYQKASVVPGQAIKKSKFYVTQLTHEQLVADIQLQFNMNTAKAEEALLQAISQYNAKPKEIQKDQLLLQIQRRDFAIQLLFEYTDQRANELLLTQPGKHVICEFSTVNASSVVISERHCCLSTVKDLDLQLIEQPDKIVSQVVIGNQNILVDGQYVFYLDNQVIKKSHNPYISRVELTKNYGMLRATAILEAGELASDQFFVKQLQSPRNSLLNSQSLNENPNIKIKRQQPIGYKELQLSEHNSPIQQQQSHDQQQIQTSLSSFDASISDKQLDNKQTNLNLSVVYEQKPEIIPKPTNTPNDIDYVIIQSQNTIENSIKIKILNVSQVNPVFWVFSRQKSSNTPGFVSSNANLTYEKDGDDLNVEIQLGTLDQGKHMYLYVWLDANRKKMILLTKQPVLAKKIEFKQTSAVLYDPSTKQLSEVNVSCSASQIQLLNGKGKPVYDFVSRYCNAFELSQSYLDPPSFAESLHMSPVAPAILDAQLRQKLLDAHFFDILDFAGITGEFQSQVTKEFKKLKDKIFLPVVLQYSACVYLLLFTDDNQLDDFLLQCQQACGQLYSQSEEVPYLKEVQPLKSNFNQAVFSTSDEMKIETSGGQPEQYLVLQSQYVLDCVKIKSGNLEMKVKIPVTWAHCSLTLVNDFQVQKLATVVQLGKADQQLKLRPMKASVHVFDKVSFEFDGVEIDQKGVVKFKKHGTFKQYNVLFYEDSVLLLNDKTKLMFKGQDAGGIYVNLFVDQEQVQQ